MRWPTDKVADYPNDRQHAAQKELSAAGDHREHLPHPRPGVVLDEFEHPLKINTEAWVFGRERGDPMRHPTWHDYTYSTTCACGRKFTLTHARLSVYFGDHALRSTARVVHANVETDL